DPAVAVLRLLRPERGPRELRRVGLPEQGLDQDRLRDGLRQARGLSGRTLRTGPRAETPGASSPFAGGSGRAAGPVPCGRTSWPVPEVRTPDLMLSGRDGTRGTEVVP